MRFNTKIEKCCDKHSLRYYLQDVYYDKKKKCLIASDGHKIVFLHCDDEASESGVIPKEAIIFARKLRCDLVIGEKEIDLSTGHKFPSGLEHPNPDMYDSILEKNTVTEENACHTIIINAQFLLDVALALTQQGRDPIVKLCFPEDKTQGILIKSDYPDEEKSFGILMPCKDS